MSGEKAAIMCACVHIDAGVKHMLLLCRQTKYAALRATAADTCDNRVNEKFFIN